MKCPRCGNEWDVSKSPCSSCGLRVHLPASLRAARSSSSSQDQRSQPGEIMPARSQMLASEGIVSSSLPGNVQMSAGSPTVSRPQFPRPPASVPGIPARPQIAPPRGSQVSSALVPVSQRLPSPLRAKRLVTGSSFVRDDAPMMGDVSPMPVSTSYFLVQQEPNLPSLKNATRVLMPGTLLHNGRYRLHELLSHQEWLAGAYEGMWVAQDAQRGGAAVAICELILPEPATMRSQFLLRTSTMALTSIGRHPRVPTLWDAFSDQNRNFFVFEAVDGESLLMRMRRTGRALPERDVIECCLQVLEVLELLAQQMPPLVHGLIRPEHIFISSDGSRYSLTNFSVVLAGGGTELIAGIEDSRLSPYTAPELVRGLVDPRFDLYSLLATAYHVVTGSMPVAMNGSIPHAQRLNPTVSARLEAILARGLHPSVGQRYQHLSELRGELSLLQTSNDIVLYRNSASLGEHRFARSGPLPSYRMPETKPSLLPATLAPMAGRESFAHSQELPSFEERDDVRLSLLWIAGIVLCLIVVVLFSRGLG